MIPPDGHRTRQPEVVLHLARYVVPQTYTTGTHFKALRQLRGVVHQIRILAVYENADESTRHSLSGDCYCRHECQPGSGGPRAWAPWHVPGGREAVGPIYGPVLTSGMLDRLLTPSTDQY